jgi:capsular polysaccharide biosynthesis protein
VSVRVEFPPPTTRETLAEVLPRFGGSTDSAGVVTLPGGRVYGSGIVLAPDGRSLVAEFARDFGDVADGRHWLQDYRRMRPPVPISGRTAVVAVNLGSRYAHWLLEELPRWLSLRPGMADNVIANTGSPFIRDVLALINPPRRPIPVSRHSHYTCETLVVPPIAQPTPSTLGMLKAFAEQHRSPAAAPAEKLYITREHATRRRVVNEAELWSALAARGFVKLSLETLPWRDQVAAFAAAKIVVAPHGAGLANLVFCRPGTRAVEFFNRSYVNPCFGTWAEAAALDYRAIIPEGPDEIGRQRQANRMDIIADVSAVIAALERM